MTSSQGELRAAVASWRGSWLATGAFSFCINLLMLTAPLYMLQVYDRVLASRSDSTLVALTLLAGSMLLVMGVLDLIRGRVMVRIGTGLDSQLSGRVFDAGFEASRSDAEAGRSQPVRDLDTVRQFLTGPGPFALFDAPWMPVYAGLVYLMHPSLGLVAGVGALALMLVALVNEMRTRPPVLEAGREASIANGLVETSLRNIEVLQALGMQHALSRRWRQHHECGMAYQAQASDRGGALASVSKSIRLLLQIAILGVGAHLAIQQIITPGSMIAASILMGRALAPVELAIGQWRGFVLARSAYARLSELLDRHPVPADATQLPAPSGRLSVEELAAGPPGSETPVLSGITFALEPGEVLGVIGPTASGKSSLARHLTGVWAPLRGSVRVDGAELADWHRAGFASHLGYLPQDVELFAGTVAENIARLAEKPDSEQVVRAAMRAGAHEMILRLPSGYDSQIGADGSHLSGGQRQRIGLARALYGDPVLVVLDEPNANLDSDGDEALRRAVHALKKAMATVVLMVHRPAALAEVDKVLVLGEGRMQSFGTRAEVLGKARQRSQEAQRSANRSVPRRVVRVGRPDDAENQT